MTTTAPPPAPSSPQPSALRARLAACARHRRVRQGAVAFLALVVLFGLLGYFWLPGFAKGKLESLLAAEFERPVRIDRIDVSPYTLSATISGFAVGEKGAEAGVPAEQRLVGFDSLYVNLSAMSLARALPVVSEVRLVGPYVHLVRESGNRYNVSDLIEKWTAKPSEGPTPAFSVANVTVQDGRIDFEDKPVKVRHEVSELALGIPFLANTPGTVESYVEPHFAAKLNGAPLSLGGKLRPFAPGKDAVVDVEIRDFNLAGMDAYIPANIPLTLNAAKLEGDLAVTFAQAEGKTPTVGVTGELAVTGLAAKGEKVAVNAGALRLAIQQADLDPAKPLEAALTVQDVALARHGEKQPFLGFGALKVEGVSVNLASHQAKVAAVTLEKPQAGLRRLKGGELDLVQSLQSLVPGPVAKAAPPEKGGKADKGEKTEKIDKASPVAPANAKAVTAWAWEVGQAKVTGGALRYSDDTLEKVQPLVVDGLAVQLAGLSSASGKRTTLGVEAKINEQGRFKVDGEAAFAPAGADLNLDLEQVNLVALQGWVADQLNAVLTKGDLTIKGKLKAEGSAVAFNGDVNLTDFNVLDKLNAADLLRWKSLRLSGVEAGSTPPRFAVGEIALASFYARAILSPEGRLNLQDIVKQDEAPPAAVAGSDAAASGAAAPAGAAAVLPPAPAAPAAAAAPAKAKGPAAQVRIGKVTLAGGNINFTDRFIKPNYSANLTDLSGRIGTLAAGTLAELAVKGKVDRTAPLDISGKIDPLGKPIALDVQARAKGIEMSSFTPYSGRYVGYAIEKGKLSVDVQYKVEKGELQAQNKIFIDQLTFGEKVESPNALGIPIGLVVALLKNSRGEIDLNLPVQGSLNDPQFSIGGIVGKMILNLLVKAVTSPFALLSSLFGGGEELSYVAFDAGHGRITPEVEKRLESIAKALNDRPSLKLEITGTADPAAEREGLKRAILDRKVRAQKLAEQAKGGKASGSLADVSVSAEEYPRYLEKAYKEESFKKPRNFVGLTKSLPVPEMEALMLANIPAEDDELRQLAQRRGTAVQTWLAEKGGVPVERMFLLTPKVGGEAPKGAPAGGRVEFSLQ
ncbi:DUF748 domain-containing protein [Azospira sp. I13]|uniref:DUF748 domain-containing protein n=1 Tax=Azospira sp. I13 TaxID=1765050 RepID=UPI000D59342D|nr:DUF748 domain-containing protein [Azospira sp. I13]